MPLRLCVARHSALLAVHATLDDITDTWACLSPFIGSYLERLDKRKDTDQKAEKWRSLWRENANYAASNMCLIYKPNTESLLGTLLPWNCRTHRNSKSRKLYKQYLGCLACNEARKKKTRVCGTWILLKQHPRARAENKPRQWKDNNSSDVVAENREWCRPLASERKVTYAPQGHWYG